ncbi:bifunctional UDP-N-acetylglucosamine diphosphorylase/glucosamine-1-phosphate N-acetyltransferase GlmU [Candidatus Desantisbacteria bacterium]|nr:bifunctional UDP-N-acetylglucosamine diphosphorylase/glucosamine-1-phosphate N-acetyltransferase GlmU [Candidatus Desantisbacteria bacterium]
MEKLSALILAAGAGTRMKSALPKVLHPILGKPMIKYILDVIRTIKLDNKIVIIGNQKELVKRNLEDEKDISFVIQDVQQGTGHAVMQVEKELENYNGNVLILYGDTPLLKKETIQNLIKSHNSTGAGVTILTCVMTDPTGYGRIIRNSQNEVIKITEEKDTTILEKKVKEINTGIYCFNSRKLFEMLKFLQPDNKQKELYLTDVIEMFSKKKYKINTQEAENQQEIMGINNRSELAKVSELIRKSILEYWMRNGVTIIHPESTFIDADVKIENDVTIYPFTIIEGKSIIKSNCIIGPFSYVKDSSLSNGVELNNSRVIKGIINKEAKVGPFANIRPGTVLEASTRIGNFCEIKKSHIGEGSKVSHLSYIGDSDIGKDVNIGAGTITCNFDGESKHKTIIEDNVFIGSNTNLIAPVSIKKGALVAAGSTITRNVPEKALGIAREKQFNIAEYNKKRKKKISHNK